MADEDGQLALVEGEDQPIEGRPSRREKSTLAAGLEAVRWVRA